MCVCVCVCVCVCLCVCVCEADCPNVCVVYYISINVCVCVCAVRGGAAPGSEAPCGLHVFWGRDSGRSLGSAHTHTEVVS